MTEDEAFLIFLDKGNPVAKAMWKFRGECARLEQAEHQRKPPSQKARILMEYHAVKAIIEAAGLQLPTDPIHIHEGQFWFWDETWSNRHGPYRTRDGAEKDLQTYCAQLIAAPRQPC